MNNITKISIVTVSYDVAGTIEQTISSVVNQTYENIEYIIIDGGSTDGTVDIIRKYEDKIAYWVSETDRGIYDAMNKGIDVATGDYIYFLGADDILFNLPIISISNAWHDNIDILLGKVKFSNGYVYSSKAEKNGNSYRTAVITCTNGEGYEFSLDMINK